MAVPTTSTVHRAPLHCHGNGCALTRHPGGAVRRGAPSPSEGVAEVGEGGRGRERNLKGTLSYERTIRMCVIASEANSSSEINVPVGIYI